MCHKTKNNKREVEIEIVTFSAPKKRNKSIVMGCHGPPGHLQFFTPPGVDP
jgi:hypothetical protein